MSYQIVGAGTDGQLWRTLRADNGSWRQDFGAVAGQPYGGPTTFAAINGSPGTQGLLPTRTLNLTIPGQEQPYWCWVAVGSGVAFYYDNVTHSQRSVVTLVFQTIHPPFNLLRPGKRSLAATLQRRVRGHQALDHPESSLQPQHRSARCGGDQNRDRQRQTHRRRDGVDRRGYTLRRHHWLPGHDFDHCRSAYWGDGSYISTTLSET